MTEETWFDRIFPYLFIASIPIGFFTSAWLYLQPYHSCYAICIYHIPALISSIALTGVIIEVSK